MKGMRFWSQNFVLVLIHILKIFEFIITDLTQKSVFRIVHYFVPKISKGLI